MPDPGYEAVQRVMEWQRQRINGRRPSASDAFAVGSLERQIASLCEMEEHMTNMHSLQLQMARGERSSTV